MGRLLLPGEERSWSLYEQERGKGKPGDTSVVVRTLDVLTFHKRGAWCPCLEVASPPRSSLRCFWAGR